MRRLACHGHPPGNAVQIQPDIVRRAIHFAVLCRKTAQLIQRFFTDIGPQRGQVDFNAFPAAAKHGFVQFLLLRLDELLRQQLLLCQLQILRLPQDRCQQPLLCTCDPQRLTAARAVGQLDLVHFAGLEHLLPFLPAAPVSGLFHCRFQLGHNGCFRDIGLLCQTARIHLLLGRVGALCQHIHSFLDVFQPLRVLCQIVLAAQTTQPEIQCIAHTVQQRLEPFCTVLFDVLVRVFRPGDLQNAHFHRAVAEQFQ